MHMATVKVSGKGQISIPKRFRKLLGLKEGNELVLIEERGRIVMERVESLARKIAFLEGGEGIATMLASQKSLSKEWENEEDERWNAV